MIIESRAFARAGLLGNPSDGYFGKTVSVILKNFSAQITLYESPKLVFEPQEADTNSFRSLHHLSDTISLVGYSGGIPLLKATTKKFLAFAHTHGIKVPHKNFTVSYNSSIPRQVGLAGSSAIVTAMLRALSKFYQVEIPKHLLPTLTLSVETEELGITAGLQDRVIQAYEGCVYMDFNKEHLERNKFGIYEAIPTEKLPKLYIAYKTNLSKVSGKVLNTVRQKWEAGDKLVHKVLAETADLALQGKEALLADKQELLPQLINQNFDNRAKIMPISDSNYEMINIARAFGASASFTGSGGAIIGTYKDDAMLNQLFYSLKKIDARVVKPLIS